MRNKRDRRIGSALTAEFGPALIIFFLVILFPMINLIGLGMGAGTLYLMAVECATKAGNSTSFPDALAAAEAAANNLKASGFGQFAKLTPIGGYNGSGMDLYVTDTNINTNVSTTNGPNTPFVSTLDSTNYLYSYDAKVIYNVGPFMNMGAVPWIGSVPGIGVPAQLSFTVSRNVEHPETLIANGGGGGPGGGPGTGRNGGGGGGNYGGGPGGGPGGDFSPPTGGGNGGTDDGGGIDVGMGGGPGGGPGDGTNGMH